MTNQTPPKNVESETNLSPDLQRTEVGSVPGVGSMGVSTTGTAPLNPDALSDTARVALINSARELGQEHWCLSVPAQAKKVLNDCADAIEHLAVAQPVVNSVEELDATTNLVLSEVAAERERQNAKWGEQNHYDGTGDDRRLLGDTSLPTFGTICYRSRNRTDELAVKGQVNWAEILLEEVFEALSATSETDLRTELIQVAAVAAQWIEAIDRRPEAPGA